MGVVILILLSIGAVLLIAIMYAKGLGVDFLWFKFDRGTKSTWNRNHVVSVDNKRSVVKKWGYV